MIIKRHLPSAGVVVRALVVWALLALAGPAHAFHFPWDQGHDTTASKDPSDPGPDPRPPCDPCNANATNSPVYAALGHAIWQDTDVVLRGRPYIGVVRAYNSNDPVVGLFGNGWTVDFDVALYPATDSGTQERIYKAANGKRFIYAKQANGSYLAPAARFETISEGPSSVTMTMLDGRRMVFANDGRLLQRIDTNGNVVSFGYDGALRPTRIDDGHGRSLTLSYNSASLVGAVTDQGGRTWRYGYDSSANLVSVTDPAGGVMRYTWQAYRPPADANTYSQLTSVKDASGVVTVAFTYSGNQVASYTEGANRYTYSRSTANTTVAGTVTETDATGVATSFTYGALGLITQRTNGIGGRTSYTYDANGRITAVVDPIGRTWTSAFDSLGRMTSSSNTLGQTTTMQYTGSDPRPVRMTSPGGRIVTMGYDAHGNLLASTDPIGAVTRIGYNGAGDAVSVANALSQQTNVVYSATGLPTLTTDPLGRTSSMSYDALGRVIAAANAAGETTRYSYDLLDRVTAVVDPLNQTTAFTYDATGRLTSVTDAKGSVTRYEYDANGRRSAEVAPDGRRTTYVYRADNLLSSINWPDATTISYSYDGNKRVTRETAGSEVITYAYNAVDQLLSASGPGGTVAYTYDNAGRLASETSGGKTNTVTRNADGERIGLAYLGQSLSYSRNTNGWVTRIAGVAGTFDFTFDALGRRTGLSYPNGSSASYAFDSAGQLTALAHAGIFNAPYNYAFDAGGRITRTTGDGPDWSYVYDALGRLTRATQGTSTYAYTFDAVGNILDGGRVYDVNHRLISNATTDFGYDPRGNLVIEQDRSTGARTVYQWNAKNQLLQVQFFSNSTATAPGRVLAYQYDPVGRRASKTDNGAVQRFVYDGDDLVGILDAGNNVVAVDVFSGSIDEPLATVSGASATFNFANHLGSVMASATGSVVSGTFRYGPHGEAATPATVNATGFKYTGREKDAESLYYYRARYYSTATQRFLSADPAGLSAGANLYAYADGDGVNARDPTGNCPWCIGAAIGFGTDLVGQLISNGWNVKCVNWGQVALSTGLGALGGGLGGKGLTSALRGLSNGAKGEIGEALSIANNRLMGSRLVDTQVRIPGQRTIVDSVWRSLTGETYYVESKFGTAGLTGAQRAASQALGDSYNVERWGYPFFERVGGYFGGGAGAAAGAGLDPDCGCK